MASASFIKNYLPQRAEFLFFSLFADTPKSKTTIGTLQPKN